MRKLIPLFVLIASCVRAPATLTPQEVGVVRVPLTLEGGMPWVDAKIGGRPVRLLLDLGGFERDRKSVV